MKTIKRDIPISKLLTIKGKARGKLLAIANASRSSSNGHYIIIKNQTRKITVSAAMYVVDDEWFTSDETVKKQKTNSAILDTSGIAQTVMEFEVRMGGEIRVEFTVDAALIDNDGNAVVNGDIKLFEGITESTGDLDGEREFQLYCPADAVVNHFVRVNNDDEGGDYATVHMTITNTEL